MRLTLTLHRQQEPPVDLTVTADTTVTVGEVARTLQERDPLARPVSKPTIALGADILPIDLTVNDSPLQRGVTVGLVPSNGDATRVTESNAATLLIVTGPSAGDTFPLRRGANTIGRAGSNQVRLSDPTVSQVHARIVVTDVVEIIDCASANGVRVGGALVERAVLRAEDVALLGGTVIRVVHGGAASRDPGGKGELFNRSPRLENRYAGAVMQAPAPPVPPTPQPFTWAPMLAPLLLGPALFAITRQPATLLFLALSPLLLLGTVLERRLSARRAHRKALRDHEGSVARLRDELAVAQQQEALARRTEHPSVEELVSAAAVRAPLLWSGRPDRPGFLELRLGLGSASARNQVELSRRAQASDAQLWQQLLTLEAEAHTVTQVPIVAALTACGCLGVTGPASDSAGVMSGLIAQLVCRHSPNELVLAAAVPSAGVEIWGWLKWLPHVAGEHSPLSVDPLASEPASVGRLVAALEELVALRGGPQGRDQARPMPAVVVLVHDEAPVDRSRLVALGESGPAVGVHLLWLAPSLGRLPAACRVYLELPPGFNATASVGFVLEGERQDDVAVESLDVAAAEALARSLAPLVDAGGRTDDQSDLPPSVPLLTLLGTDRATSADGVLAEWRAAGSLPSDPPRRSHRHTLRATVGMGADQQLVLDLREHGPHALVGGTTGSGKSEFLQTWVTALALAHSAARLTFLFVDYKGEAAFGQCVNLPHSVGLVSDLNPHLVRRALVSLRAELRHREQQLRKHQVKDLAELERRVGVGILPSLVIVVDEFAALIKEIPEFVDGMVDIAQRGRSLGLHLVLATQRPAGVVRDNLRANTNLRVALRVADEDDSTDVLGIADAASFDPSLPGRAMAKLGPGRVTAFQSAYVGGHTPDAAPPSPIVVVEQPFGAGKEWEPSEQQQEGGEPEAQEHDQPTDLEQIVAAVTTAHTKAALPTPRRPWLEPLSAAYDLDELRDPTNPHQLEQLPGTRPESELVFGVQDDPDNQRRVPAVFRPDRDGSIVVFGTGGSGKSTFLRTLALAAADSADGPCYVYGLDFGAQGLRLLDPRDKGAAAEVLPKDLSSPAHVGGVIGGDDDERVVRLLRMLRDLIDDRAVRYARQSASTLADYRLLGDAPDEPRILLLVDGIGAFRTAYEVGVQARWFDIFQSIVADGRAVGVHVALSADRSTAVPSSLSSLIQRRLVLRVAGDGYDDPLLRVPRGAFGEDTPPGRGFLNGVEVQVAVPAGSASTTKQAHAIEALAKSASREDRLSPPTLIKRLPEQVTLAQLPSQVNSLPAFGLEDLTLSPIGFTPTGTLLVTGPPGSGRTSLITTLTLSYRRLHPDAKTYYLGNGPSPLPELLAWTRSALTVEDAGLLAEELCQQWTQVGPASITILDGLPDFLSTPTDAKLQTLIRTGRRLGHLLVIEGETSAMTSGYPLMQLVKAGRHGIALQPDQTDGDNLFKTSFPRIQRAAFPAGRGFYVRSGQALRVQCAKPEVD